MYKKKYFPTDPPETKTHKVTGNHNIFLLGLIKGLHQKFNVPEKGKLVARFGNFRATVAV